MTKYEFESMAKTGRRVTDDTTAREALIDTFYRAYRTAQMGREPVLGEFEATYSRLEATWIGSALDALLASPALDAVVAQRLAALAEEFRRGQS